jgi:hypothetical protein
VPVAGRPGALVVAGLAGSALMAAGSLTAGALPGADPGVRAGGGYWAGVLGWGVGLLVLAAAWWRLGRAVHHRAGWSAARLLAVGALWAVPLLCAPPLASRDVYAYACQGWLWRDGVDPYAVGVAAGGCPWTASVPELWRDTTTPYGPVAVGVSGAVVAVARAVAAGSETRLLVAVGLFRLLAVAATALAAGLLPRLARRCGVDPAAAVWLAALSPLVLVHAVGGAHNDALMLALVLAALRVATGAPGVGRALAAGALLGLAVAVKVTALVAVPFAVLLTVLARRPAGRRTGSAVVPAMAVPVAGVAVFALASAVTGLGLGWVDALSGTGRLVQWTSLPSGVGMAVGYLARAAGHPELFDRTVALARLLGLVTLLAVAAWCLLRATRAVRGRAADDDPAARRTVLLACAVTFAAAAVLAPVFYPWYALTPLAVAAAGLAGWSRVRWVAGTVVGLSVLVLPNGLGLAVRTKLPGALADLAAVVTLLVLAVRRRGRSGGPEENPVRGGGADGPRAGR